MQKTGSLRDRLVAVALEWQRRYGVAPPITAPISELDAARLVGMPDEAYSKFKVTSVHGRTRGGRMALGATERHERGTFRSV